MIQKFNYIITRLFDFILYPFSFINEFWGILFLSIIMSFIVLWIYKWISSPHLVRRAKDQIKANILAIRLYKDSGKIIIISFLKSLVYIFKYFGLNLLPLLIIIPILFPAFSQMDIRYGKRAFHEGEEFTVKAKFNPNIQGINIELIENEHFTPKMKPVFIKALNEVNWKLKAQKPGATQLQVKVQDQIYEKALWIGESRDAISNKRMKESSWEHFIYPAEKRFPNGKLEKVIIKHPGKEITFAGITLHWIIYNLILVVLIVLALKNRFGIEF